MLRSPSIVSTDRRMYAEAVASLFNGVLSSTSLAVLYDSQGAVGQRPAMAPRPLVTREHRLPVSSVHSLATHGPAAVPPADTRGRQGRIFRRGFSNSELSGGTALSIDLPPRKFVDLFCDFDSKRCLLCGETITQWHQHQNGVPHGGREALLLELVRAQCGRPEEIVAMWTRRLLSEPMFQRINALSHEDGETRRRRLLYLLRVLKDRRVLVHTFDVMERGSCLGARRSWDFERLEWEGDNVIKYAFCNVLNCVFPVSEGGLRGQLTLMQFVMDGNDGLARAYDYLELCRLTSNDRIVSKFKSDVVECLFGELQFYLLSTEVRRGTYCMPLPFSPEMHTLRALVRHVMSELAIVIFLFHASHVLSALQRVVEEHQVHFVRTDAAGTTHTTAAAAPDASAAGQQADTASSPSNSSPTAGVPMSGYHLSAIRLTRNAQGLLGATMLTTPHLGPGAAMMEINIGFGVNGAGSHHDDAFSRVVPLSGLHASSRVAAAAALSPSLMMECDVTYMPELQVVPQLSSRLPQIWARYTARALRDATSELAETECVEDCLAPRPCPRAACPRVTHAMLARAVYRENYRAYDLVADGGARGVARGA